MPFRSVSSLTIVNEGPSLSIVNEGSSLTIVNKTSVLKKDRFKNDHFWKTNFLKKRSFFWKMKTLTSLITVKIVSNKINYNLTLSKVKKTTKYFQWRLFHYLYAVAALFKRNYSISLLDNIIYIHNILNIYSLYFWRKYAV